MISGDWWQDISNSYQFSCHVLVWTGSICKFKVKSYFRNMYNTCWLLFGWWEHWDPNIEIQTLTSKQLSIAYNNKFSYCATLTSQSHPRDQSPVTLFTMAAFSLIAKNFHPTYERTWSTIDPLHNKQSNSLKAIQTILTKTLP